MNRTIFRILSVIVIGTAAALAFADTESFDQVRPGALPPGWECGVTGRGSPHWAVEIDSSAPSKPKVLKQTGSGTFPWCVKKAASIADGFVEVKFKPLAGREDQAGGLVWRWKDGDNYYIARANALEGNVSLYHTEGGHRLTIKYADAPVTGSQWHRLRVEFSAKHIKVLLDGKPYIELEDGHITGAGAVGVWTKADSVTAFDDFSFGDKTGTIVFVCRYGSAKSVVAARFFNRLAAEKGLPFHAVPRGIEPEPVIPPYVREPIRADRFEIGPEERPVPLDAGETRDAVAVVCIMCKLPPGQLAVARQSIEWTDVPDVSEGYAAARDRILGHMKELMVRLGGFPMPAR